MRDKNIPHEREKQVALQESSPQHKKKSRKILYIKTKIRQSQESFFINLYNLQYIVKENKMVIPF